MMHLAAFAEYTVVTADCAVAVPRDLPRACLLGRGVLTGVGGATRIAQVRYGDSVLVIGCGAVGRSALQAAVLAGASTVIAVDVNPAKLAIARDLGATHAIDAGNAVAGVGALTAGRGADVVLEAVGHPDAFSLSVEACRTGGQIVWLGKVGVGQDVAFRWGSLMGEKRINRSS